MKRKVLALTLSLVLICSSTMVVAAAGDVSNGESSLETVSGETAVKDDAADGADKNEVETDSDGVSDENKLENIGEVQENSDENKTGNIKDGEKKSDVRRSDNEVKDGDGKEENSIVLSLDTENAADSLSDSAIAEGDIDFDAVDADGDNYWDSDVELINALIENNGLDWEKDAPEKWDEIPGGGIEWDTVDVSGLSRVGGLNISGEGMTGSIDLSGLERLTYLDCSGNALTGLNVQGCERLEELSCSDNDLSELNLEDLNNLRDLKSERNRLEKLNLSVDNSLESLNCTSNNLAELELLEQTELRYLYCSENSLENLDVSKCKKLSWLECNNNNLKSLNVSGLTELWALHVSGNDMEVLDVSGLKSLNVLVCSENILKELDVSSLKALTGLQCSGNRLEELDLSGLVNLEQLAFGENGNTTGICGYNPLKTLTLPAGNTITFNSTDGGYIDVRINPLYASCGQTKEDTVIGFRPVADEGYEFKSWNDLPENVSDTGWWSSPYDGEAVEGWVFVDIGENITISANFGLISEYTVIEGAGGTWSEESGGNLTMRADGEFDKFQSVQVDGVTVDPIYYTAEQGSTIITLKSEFLQTLTAGTHTLTIFFNDGAASADFVVKEVQEEENAGNQPGEGQNPGEGSKPEEGQQPGEGSKPEDEQQPSHGADSDNGQQNGDTNAENNGQQISGTDENDNAGQSGNATVTKVEKTQDISKAVKTGDESNVAMLAGVMIIALLACMVTGCIKIKKKR